ncbi:MAG TPA: NAD-dependent deacylase [Bacteroidia bacterium]|nr:NAD-dependent deacylase [Bacteroidia bacterium]HNT80346.1 NAD-dependent deacylase [Bacteroidia bacterium]
MKKVVVFSGAGMSAESGLKTFRDSDGLWENYSIEDVATPQAFANNPELVLRFYNERRQQIRSAKPNPGHLALVQLEEKYNVEIITQNIDDLHERAGSKNVLHLHGEILKARSSAPSESIYHLGNKDIQWGDVCEQGFQLRPHIVWFGEMVPMLEHAIMKVQMADILLIIGTSLQVYPAASLIHYVPSNCKIFYIDPNPASVTGIENINVIQEAASTGIQKCVSILNSES